MTNTHTAPALALPTETPILPGVLDDDYTVSMGGHATITAKLGTDGIVCITIATPTSVIEQFVPAADVSA